ncbi:MAG TPA: universal stress protein, partial [Nitrososphaeraceae archaeon]|nr:universal stress protein [Nitrososphaeraceae archaeon]
MFSRILVAFDGSKPSMDAVESAMEIGTKYNSSLIILHVIDSYKYPYLLSSVILAPTYGSDKLEKEREKFEELM